MKTTVLRTAMLLGLAGALCFAESPARRSKWVPLPPKTATISTPGSSAALIGALSAGPNLKSRNRASLQDRLALQQALPGTWLFNITPQGADAPPPFVSLTQFSSEGNFIETESDLLTPPAATPGIGVWAAAPSRSFDLIFSSFLFDDAGNFIGTTKIVAHGQLSQDSTSLKGTYNISGFDPNGAVLFTGSGAFDGTPFAAQGSGGETP